MRDAIDSDVKEKRAAVIESVKFDSKLIKEFRARQQLVERAGDSPAEGRIQAVYDAFLGEADARDPVENIAMILSRIETIFRVSEDQPVTRFSSALVLLRYGRPRRLRISKRICRASR